MKSYVTSNKEGNETNTLRYSSPELNTKVVDVVLFVLIKPGTYVLQFDVYF